MVVLLNFKWRFLSFFSSDSKLEFFSVERHVLLVWCLWPCRDCWLLCALDSGSGVPALGLFPEDGSQVPAARIPLRSVVHGSTMGSSNLELIFDSVGHFGR